MSDTITHRILIVEDDALIGAVLQEQVQALGYACALFQESGAALDLVQKETFALALIDERIGGAEGIRLVQDLARVRPDVVRMMLSSGREITALNEATRSGLIFRYMTKPWLRDDLAMLLRNAAEQFQLKAEVAALRSRNQALNAELSQAGVGDSKSDGVQSSAVGIDTAITLAVRILQTYHPNLGNASLRAVALCRTMAELMEVQTSELSTLLWAAALHDVGLVSVERGIVRRWLRDPAKCTDEELALLRAHSAATEIILNAIPSLSTAAKVCRHHHEHVDGTGYPDGLKGETIPLFSRILAPVVHFCHRPGSSSQILAEMEALSDRQFDPMALRMLAKAIPMTTMPRGEREVLLIELRAGMTLGRDILNSSGHLLLPKGRELKDSDINRIQGIHRVTPLDPYVLVYC